MTETEMKWAERVGAWRAGGQTASEFARDRGFEGSTLRYWASRLARARKETTAGPSATPRVRLVRVTPSGSSQPLTVSVGVARIEVRTGFNRALLREVIDALGGLR